jgi:transposase-like protein
MTKETLREALIQAEEKEAAQLINEVLRGCVRGAIVDLMAEEAEALCGAKYRPDPESGFRRAGSERGHAYIEGEREEIRRPRVREKDGGEVPLASYQAASSPMRLFDQVIGVMDQGLGARAVSRSKSTGSLSKSEASRMWVERSREQLAEFRNRDLKTADWVAIFIDGVRLADEIWVVAAVGVDEKGNKLALDFEEGPSENASVCKALLSRLKARGIDEAEDRRLLICRDGSKALASAITQHWPKAVQQECLVHCQRETRQKVRQRDRAELDGLFKILRDAQGKKAGEEAFDELLDFVSERNAAAGIALEKRRAGLLAFHRLDVPSTLNTTFLSTNVIENVFNNWREATGNVKHWSEKKDMISRWSASGLLWAEVGFRKVRGYKEMPKLMEALTPKNTPDPLVPPPAGEPSPEPRQADVSLTTPLGPVAGAEEENSLQTEHDR